MLCLPARCLRDGALSVQQRPAIVRCGRGVAYSGQPTGGSEMKIGRLLLRLVVGGLFVGHGTQKLFGWFGGNGLDATAQGFEQLGLRRGRKTAIAAGAAEAGGGALLAVGLATPLAASILIATMLTAIHRVHGPEGPWLTDGGYEYNLVLIAAALALVEGGPGGLSLDGALGRER